MNITKRDIDNFNRKIIPFANDEYNKLRGIYTHEVFMKLRRIKDSQWGMLNKPITLKHVKEWIDYV